MRVKTLTRPDIPTEPLTCMGTKAVTMVAGGCAWLLWRLDVVEGAAQLASAECQDCALKTLPAHASAAQMKETGPGGRAWLLRKLETLEGAVRVAYAECEKMYSKSSPSMSLALPRNHRLTEKGPEAPAPAARTSSQAVPSQAMQKALCGQEDGLH